MSWVEHAVLWHVYPLGFTGAPIRDAAEPAPAHRLPRLTAWLDYAVELGVSGLSLGPVFASQSHGYDSTDQFRVDPRLGTGQDLDDLLAACRRRGLRVVLDGVFNHVGDQHRSTWRPCATARAAGTRTSSASTSTRRAARGRPTSRVTARSWR